MSPSVPAQPPSSAQPAVSLENVGKDFRVRAASRHWSLVGGDRGERRTLRALDGVTFQAERGEIFGVVGLNGSGKSTLLKIVAGITPATRGTVRVAGRIGSLLEVGAGFHPELSGYENVYLNGTILGLSRAELDRRMAEIVEFAGLEGFMHVPVKHYSSGMSVRLGFSIAAFSEPDVLLLDETFSVGDAEFQARALHTVLRRRDAGTAILLVSHDIDAVREHCRRALWLDEGRPRALGPAEEVVDAYYAMVASVDHQIFPGGPRAPRREERDATPFTRDDAPTEIVGMALPDATAGAHDPGPANLGGEPTVRLDHPERLLLTIGWRRRSEGASVPLDQTRLTVTLLRRSGELVVWRADTPLSDIVAGAEAAGTVRLSLAIPRFYSDTFRFVATLGPAAAGPPWSRAVVDFEIVGLEPLVAGPFPFLVDPCVAIEHRPLDGGDGSLS